MSKNFLTNSKNFYDFLRASKNFYENKKNSKYEIVVLKDGERISGKKKRGKRGKSRLFKKR